MPETTSDDTFQYIADVALGRYEATSTAKMVAEKITARPADTVESQLNSLWSDIVGVAAGDRQQDSLVEFVIALSQLPDVVDDQGKVLQVHGGTVWKDLPMFGWEINSIWNNLTIPNPQPIRASAITHFTNQVHFVSLLLRTDLPIFTPFRLQILWTFRALETPTSEIADIDAWIPAIAAAVSVLDHQIKSWDDDYSPTNPKAGKPGKGGPLWKDGKQGFSVDRYELWKKRLGEIAEDSGVSEDVRKVAREAEKGM